MQNQVGVPGYQMTPMPGNPRASEAWALMQAARKINDAKEDGDEEVINQALRLNWRLWTIFQADLLNADCQLPIEIRQNMLSLCNFIDQRTTKYFAKPDVGLLDVFININREIASGLYQQQQNQEAAPSEAAPQPPQPPAAPQGAEQPPQDVPSGVGGLKDIEA